MKKTIISLVASVLVLSGTPAYAQTSTTSTASVDQLAQLIITLKPGMTHEQVKLLQALLASDSTVFPEGTVTGYYGEKTKNAVKRFQRKHGIFQTGLVGPLTRAELNKMLLSSSTPIVQEDQDEHDGDNWMNDSHERDDHHGDNWMNGHGRHNMRFCITQAIGHTIAPGFLKKHHEDGDDRDDDKFILPRCKHGDWGTTTPPVVTTDTIAPIIANISVSGITTSGAMIAWTTNELSSSKIFLGTTSPVSTSTAAWTDASRAFVHIAPFGSLTSGTTYYYVIMSTDAANNSSVSAQGSFTTNTVPVADVTAPLISAFTASVTGSTSATVAWATNESASSKVYFSTTSPVSTLSPSVFNSSLVTAHTSVLSGLSASTTYYTMVESRDAANNTATSSQISFTTLP